MTNAKIGEIIESVGDSIQGDTGRWQFYIEDIPFICVTDSLNNRMRIISPILETIQLTEELKNASLTANFHTALDVKYAIANDLLWSVFIHPLKELSNHQVKDAIAQVYSANRSFGTTFSSTNLIFPGATKEPKNITEDKKKLKKEKF
jgi:hypothetical protein